MVTRLYVKEQDEYEIAMDKKTSVADVHLEKLRILDKIKNYYKVKKVTGKTIPAVTPRTLKPFWQTIEEVCICCLAKDTRCSMGRPL